MIAAKLTVHVTFFEVQVIIADTLGRNRSQPHRVVN
jgi:hypothetical protein